MSSTTSTNNPRKRRAEEELEKKQKRARLMPDLMNPEALVTFIIGKNKIKFQIHKDYICHHSPVLSAVVNNERFPEGKTQTYVMDDISEGCFRLFFQWIYGQKLDPEQLRDGYRADKDNTNKDNDREECEDMYLHELWVMADKYDIPTLEDCTLLTINAICRKHGHVHWKVLKFVYENTAPKSELRRYWVHQFAEVESEYFDWEENEEPNERMPYAMMKELLFYKCRLRETPLGSAEGGDDEVDAEVMELEVDLEESESYQQRKLWPFMVMDREMKNALMGGEGSTKEPPAPSSREDRMETIMTRFL